MKEIKLSEKISLAAVEAIELATFAVDCTAREARAVVYFRGLGTHEVIVRDGECTRLAHNPAARDLRGTVVASNVLVANGFSALAAAGFSEEAWLTLLATALLDPSLGGTVADRAAAPKVVIDV